jgi:amino acid adenylation domain-containing protein/non-ribosomal peptide synthase protein (TIGR01720 family)
VSTNEGSATLLSDSAGFALAPQQERSFGFHGVDDPGPYRCAIGVSVAGALEGLEERAEELCRVHEVVHSVYRRLPGMHVPLQFVVPELGLIVEHCKGADAGAIRRWVRDAPLDLTHGPVVRALIAADVHHLYLVAASATTDVAGLERLASQLLSGPDHDARADPLQVVDYAEWTRTMRTEPDNAGSELWAERTASIASPPALESAAPAVPQSRAWRVPAASLATTGPGGLEPHLLAWWQIVVARFFETEQLTVAVRSTGRLDPELAEMIGPLAAHLPVTVDVAAAPSFRRLVETDVAALHDNERWHHHAPPNVGRAAVGFAFHGAPAGDLGVVLRDERLEPFALALSSRLDGDDVCFELAYDPAVVDDATAASLEASFGRIASDAATLADRPPAQLGLLEHGARSDELRHSTGAPLTEPAASATSVLPLIEAWAQRVPEREALRWSGRPWTYGQLWQRSGQLATWLQARGAGPEDVVALHLRRSPSLIAAMLAVLRSGAAYLPLDPDEPDLRKRRLLEATSPVLVLTQRALLERTPVEPAPVACVDSSDVRPDPDATLQARRPHPDAPAYVIFTSGSTGSSKGVAVTHGGLLASTAARFGVYGEPVERFLLLSPAAFDSSVAGIYWTLCSGGALVLPSDQAQRDAQQLRALASEHEVSHLLCLPSLYRVLLAAGAASFVDLRVAIVAGERCDTDVLALHRHHLPNTRFLNEYGPTEGTVWATVHEPAGSGDGSSVPIGRPVPARRVYVLDQDRQLRPSGAPGEIHIGGAGLARGYLNDPAATAASFLPDPHSPVPGGRMYATGDRARRRPDGVLEFLGRADDQVKLRGYRIELGAIEASLAEHPEVSEAAVVVDDAGPSPRLVAFAVAPGSVVRPTEAIAHLAARLPGWMVPATIRFIDRLPTLSNGKVDRNALRDQGEATPAAAEAVPQVPQTREEETLARVWAEVLGCERVGVNENFFALGGDSLLAIQVVQRARQAGFKVSARGLFRHPTIAELLASVSDDQPIATDEQVPADAPVTPVQRWFLERRLPAANHYNQAILLEAEALDAQLLAGALDAVVGRHGALRLRIVEAAGEWRQRTAASEAHAVLEVHDVAALEHPDEAIAREIERAHRSLDIADGPVLAMRHFRCAGGRDRVFWAVHHLAVDAMSWRILVEDLELAYTALEADRRVELPPVSADHRAWASRVAALAGSPAVLDHRAHWDLQTSVPTLALPVETPPATELPPPKVVAGLPEDQTRRVVAAIREVIGRGVQDVLLASVALTLARWAGAVACRVDCEHHGREDALVGLDGSRTVGWLTTVHPVRFDFPDPGDERAAMTAALRRLDAAPESRLGYGLLAPGLPGAGPSQVLFNYLGRIDETIGPQGRLRLLDDDPGDARSPLNPAAYRLEINACLRAGRLELQWTYDPRTLSRATVEQRAAEHLALVVDVVGAASA